MFGFVVHLRKKGGKEGGKREGRGKEGEKGEKEGGVTHVAGIGRHYVRMMVKVERVTVECSIAGVVKFEPEISATM